MTESQAGVQLPIEWYCPEGLVTRYANNVVVQPSENGFYISFFEIPPPLIVGPPEQQKARLEQMVAVRAECVARIVVPAQVMPAFVQALQASLGKTSKR
jgi:hypothetical protein